MSTAFSDHHLPAEVAPPAWLELQKLVGTGGMGRVFSAIDRRSGETIAVKTLSHFGGKQLIGFKNEFRSLAGVVHPNLVCQHELVEHDGQWFLLMELIEGLELLHSLRGDTPHPKDAPPSTVKISVAATVGPHEVTPPVAIELPLVGEGSTPFAMPTSFQRRRAPLTRAQLEAALPILRQVALGIGGIHRAGYLHRDIKPSNVLVTRDGHAVLLDFGIAIAKEVATNAGNKHVVVGTLAYLAPEILKGKPPSTASDWYSFGVILFEALAGQRPFESFQLGQARVAPSVGPYAPEASAELVGLVDRLLSTDPVDRPSLSEVMSALGAPAEEVLAPQTAPLPEGTMVGRRLELTRLEAVAEESRLRPTTLFLEGRSGVGKSVLLDELARRLEDKGYTVLKGRCYEHELVPYRTVDKVVDALCSELEQHKDWAPPLAASDVVALAQAFPVLRDHFKPSTHADALARDEPAELQERAIRALTELLQFIATKTPLAVCIDDLQWAEVIGAESLARLSSPGGPPVLVLCGFRSEDANGPTLTAIGELFRQERGAPVEVMTLEPLTFDESSELAGLIAAEAQIADPRVVRWALKESAGQPFFLHELLYAAAQNPSMAHPGVGGGLHGVMAKRIERLSADARALLEAVCLAGAAVPTEVAIEAAGIQGAAAKAFQVLKAGHFIRTTKRAERELIDAYHGTFREAVEASVEPAQKERIHARLVEAWARLPADAMGRGFWLAHHAKLAGAHIEWSRAFTYARDAAAEAASTFDSRHARELLLEARGLALRNHYAPPPDFELMLGNACLAAHDVEEATGAFNRALSSKDPTVLAGSHAGLARLSMGNLDTRSALAQLGHALEALGRQPARPSRFHVAQSLIQGAWSLLKWSKRQPHDELAAQLYSMSGLAGYFLLDQRLVVSGVMRSVSIGHRLAGGGALAEAYALIAAGVGLLGAPRLMHKLLARAERVANDARDPAARAFVAGFGALAVDMSGDALEGARLGVAAIENGARLDVSTYSTVVSCVTWNLLMRGHPLRALGILRYAQARVSARGASLVGQGHAFHAAYGTTYALMGKVEEGARRLDAYQAFLDRYAQSDVFRNLTAHGHRALFLHLTGASDEAFERCLTRHAQFGVPVRAHVQTLRHVYVARAARSGDQLLRQPLTPRLKRLVTQTLGHLKAFRRYPTMRLHRDLLEIKFRWAHGHDPLAALKVLQREAEALEAPWLVAEALIAQALWLQREGRHDESAAAQQALEALTSKHSLFGLFARGKRVLAGEA